MTNSLLSRSYAEVTRRAHSGAQDDVLISRHGYILGNRKISHSPVALRGNMRDFFHKLFVRESLISKIEPDTDEIVQFGGSGDALIDLWLGGAPRAASYVFLTDDAARLEQMREIAALDSSLIFKPILSEISDLSRSSWSSGRKTFVFTDGCLLAFRHTPPSFFNDILRPESVYAGAHVEPCGWQVLPRTEFSALFKSYAESNNRNIDLFDCVSSAQALGLLSVEEVEINTHSTNPLAPYSLIVWRRKGQSDPYSLGDAVDLSAHSSHLTYGWSEAESWGRWTDGQRADVNLTLPRSTQQALEIEIKMRAFLPPGKTSVSVDIVANGLPLKLLSVTGDIQTYRVKLKAEALTLLGTLRLSILTPEAITPKSIGSMSDERQLGVAVNSIRIIASAADPKTI